MWVHLSLGPMKMGLSSLEYVLLWSQDSEHCWLGWMVGECNILKLR